MEFDMVTELSWVILSNFVILGERQALGLKTPVNQSGVGEGTKFLLLTACSPSRLWVAGGHAACKKIVFQQSAMFLLRRTMGYSA